MNALVKLILSIVLGIMGKEEPPVTVDISEKTIENCTINTNIEQGYLITAQDFKFIIDLSTRQAENEQNVQNN